MNERRNFQRIPCGDSASLWSEGIKVNCHVLNESIGGFRVSGVHAAVLPMNFRLALEHRGTLTDVVCANAQRCGDGRFAIGLRRVTTVTSDELFPGRPESGSVDARWGASDPGPHSARAATLPQHEVAMMAHGALIHSFVDFGSRVPILCQILSIQPESLFRIQVLGGKQFDVHGSKLSPMLAAERKQQLLSLPSLDWLADIYSMAINCPVRSDPDAIVQYEFGPWC